MKKPLLSICIPTYNRAKYLEQCLEAIVSQSEFDDRVEIVISDNCSTDTTQEVGERYQSKYENIHYYRNKENVRDMNYPIVFSEAKGVLRKLTNDTIIYKPNAIKQMLGLIEENIDERPQLYFLNQGKEATKRVSSMDEYLNSISYRLTWIASVALWEEDCEDLEIMYKNAESRLGQVPMLLENFKKHKCAVIYDDVIMSGVVPKPKNLSYGLYNVFYNNYLGFLKRYVNYGELSEATYEKVRKDLLLDFFAQLVIIYKLNKGEFIFSDEKLQNLVETAYKNERYFYIYRIKLVYFLLRGYGSKFKHKILDKNE